MYILIRLEDKLRLDPANSDCLQTSMILLPHPLVKRLSKRATKLMCVFLVLVMLSHGLAVGQAQKPSTADHALLDAAYNFNVERVKQALESGADPNTTDKYGRTPLIIASGNHFDVFVHPRASEEIVRLLLKSGTNPNAVVPGNPTGIGATALLGAIMFDQHGMVVSRKLFSGAGGHRLRFLRRRSERVKQRTSPALAHHCRLIF